MNTSNVYQKHLTLDKRFKIEKGIDEKKSFTQIANDICKSNKTVSNEILIMINKSPPHLGRCQGDKNYHASISVFQTILVQRSLHRTQ